MKRVTHPTCCGCGRANPDYISERWQVRVCYDCLRRAADWLDSRGLVQLNPFAQEIFDGVFKGGTVPTQNQYTLIVTSEHTINAYSYKVIERLNEETLR